MKQNFFLTLISLVFCTLSYSQTQINFNAANNNQTVNTCNGFIIDSGGQGGPGYGNSENVTITICPDTPGEIISIDFGLFNLNTQDDIPGNPVTNDNLTVYDGNSAAANTLGTYTGTSLQGSIFVATQFNPTGCLTVQFISNTQFTGAFAASVSCSTPCSNPQAAGVILGGITSDSIQICVGEEVFFQDNGSFAQPGFSLVDYEWDFLDGTTANGTSVSHTYSTPGYYRVQLFVTDSNTDNVCQNTNLVDLEVFVGTIPTFDNFPLDTLLCLGESASFVADPNSWEVLWDGFPNSQIIDDGCIPDNLIGQSQDITLLQTGFAAGTTIANVNDIQSICFEMEHSFVGDLVILIACPNGQQMVMHQQGGGGVNLGIAVQADNVDCDDPTTIGIPNQYCFTNTATQTWVQAIGAGAAVGNILPSGNYAPIQPLSNLVGCPTNGVWTFSVIDNWGADDGTIFSFGLTLDPSYYPQTVTFQPQIGLNADSSSWSSSVSGFISSLSPDGNSVTVNPTAAGVYPLSFFMTDNFGCDYDSTFFITVEDNASVFAGNDTTICVGNAINLAPVIGNASGNCEYDLVLFDTFGDSWNGNTITVTAGGTSNTYTIPGGANATFPISAPNGSSITLNFNANGAWINECQFSLVDDAGITVLTGGPNLNSPLSLNTIANCAPTYVFDWQAITNLNNGTVEDPIWTPVLGTETLTLTVYPVGHPLCISTDQITATVIAPPFAGGDGVVEYCSVAPPEDLFIYIQNNPQTGGVWTNVAGVVQTMPFNPGSVAAGTHVYTYTIGAANCTDQATVTVSIVETEITDTTVTNVSCNIGSDGQIEIVGINIDSYSLNQGAQIPANSPFTVSNLSAGSYSIEVFSDDGCSQIMPFDVLEPDPLQITFVSADTLICNGGQATLSANGIGGSSPYVFTWSLAGVDVGVGQTILLNPPSGINNYCVELSEICGSPVTTECMIVTTETPIIPALLPDTVAGCEPHQVDFENISNGSILSTFITFGDGQDTLIMGNGAFEHLFIEPNLYDVGVIITSNLGCIYTADFNNLIEVYQNPVASFSVNPNPASVFDPIVDLQDLSFGDVVEWLWYVEGGFPIQSTLQNLTVSFPIGVEGTYGATLYVTTNGGCVDSTSREIQVVSEVIIYAPNTFTPDGDEFNQNWLAHISGIDVGSFHCIIYNRWGEMVWESYDLEIGWDGTYGGSVVQTGTYSWVINCKDERNDNKYTFNGHITVLR